MPRQRQDRDPQRRLADARRAPQGLALLRRTEARRPVPALHDLRRVRHARQAGRVGQTEPPDRADHGLLRRPAPGPVRRLRHPPLRLRSRPRRDPDPLHDLRPRAPLLPLERNRFPTSTRRSISASPGPARRPCPGQVRPFQPRLEAGTSNPTPAPSPTSTSNSTATTATSSSATSTSGCRPASPATCAASATARNPRSSPPPRGSAAPSWRPRAAPPRPRSARPTSPRGPGGHPFHAIGKMYLSGPVQGGAAQPGGGHAGAGRAL